jgi:hypothetical protein
MSQSDSAPDKNSLFLKKEKSRRGKSQKCKGFSGGARSQRKSRPFGRQFLI